MARTAGIRANLNPGAQAADALADFPIAITIVPVGDPFIRADPPVQALRLHHNRHEIHRELRMTPQKAWDLALREQRSVLRSKPNCPWWPFVWSLRTAVRVAPDGRIPIGSFPLRLRAAPGSRAVLCPHPSAHHSVLAAPPDQKAKPVVLFSNLPK